jgi:hypothetical protein
MVHLLRPGLGDRRRQREARPAGLHSRRLHWQCASHPVQHAVLLHEMILNHLPLGTGHLAQHLLPDPQELHAARTRRLDWMSPRPLATPAMLPAVLARVLSFADSRVCTVLSRTE